MTDSQAERTLRLTKLIHIVAHLNRQDYIHKPHSVIWIGNRGKYLYRESCSHCLSRFTRMKTPGIISGVWDEWECMIEGCRHSFPVQTKGQIHTACLKCLGRGYYPTHTEIFNQKSTLVICDSCWGRGWQRI